MKTRSNTAIEIWKQNFVSLRIVNVARNTCASEPQSWCVLQILMENGELQYYSSFSEFASISVLFLSFFQFIISFIFLFSFVEFYLFFRPFSISLFHSYIPSQIIRCFIYFILVFFLHLLLPPSPCFSVPAHYQSSSVPFRPASCGRHTRIHFALLLHVPHPFISKVRAQSSLKPRVITANKNVQRGSLPASWLHVSRSADHDPRKKT